MALRIDRSERQGFTIFALSGRLDADYISELARLFGPPINYSMITVDLSDVRLADRATVRFLARCEGRGIRLENCPEYIREWITREAVPFRKHGSIDEDKD